MDRLARRSLLLGAKLENEAPVNGGRNYNGPKVLGKTASLRETGPYAGKPSTAVRYSPGLWLGSKNPPDRGVIRREGPALRREPSET